MCEQSRCRDSRGNSEDEEAQKLNNHWTEKCLPESALSLVANVRSNYNQNVKLFGEIDPEPSEKDSVIVRVH